MVYLEKQNKILSKAKESMVRKYNLVTAKMQKQNDKIKSLNEKQSKIIIEKDKEIKLYHIKLRTYLQKNMAVLPINSFTEIEDIIE